AGADVVVLALPYPEGRAVAREQGAGLSGVTVVDTCNPVDFSTFDSLLTSPGMSAAEEIAAACPAALVVKAFNTTFASPLLVGHVGGLPLDVFLAGDNAGAKAQVAALARDGGLRPVDTGPLRRARELEGFQLLHMTLQGPLGLDWRSAIKLLPLGKCKKCKCYVPSETERRIGYIPVMRRIARPLIIAAALAASALTAVPASGAVLRPASPSSPPPASSVCPGATTAAFGANVCVFNPGMGQAQIQSDLDAIATQQVPVGSQFTSQRYAIFFEPGTYGSAADPLVFQVGYYTQVAGLGTMPQDTVVNGAIDVFNDLCTAGTSDCNADDNFWRSMSNLTLNVDLPSSPPAYAPPIEDPFGTGCTNSAEMWSASQAAPI